MRRVLMLVAAVAIPASGAFVALSGGQAWAKTKGPNGKVTCTTITGSVTSTITVSGCTDSGSAVTGASTKPIEATSLATGGTITWIDGNTTTIAAPGTSSTSAKKCPGYSKTAKTNPSAEKVVGSVTTDDAGLKLPGKFTGTVCISTSDQITALKPLKVS
jgi:hypothetical protein